MTNRRHSSKGGGAVRLRQWFLGVVSVLLLIIGAGSAFAQSDEKAPPESNQPPSEADLQGKAPPEAQAAPSQADLEAKAGANQAQVPPPQTPPTTAVQGPAQIPPRSTAESRSGNLARTGSPAVQLIALGAVLIAMGSLAIYSPDVRTANGERWSEVLRRLR